MRLKVGTRGSRLSLLQTQQVISTLKEKLPDLDVEVVVIKTTGDIEQDKPLIAIEAKGIFEKEIDAAVLRGEVDFAVHSMKDILVLQPPPMVITAVPPREPPGDVLISRECLPLEKLPSGSVVGTGSPRRQAQLLKLRPDLRVAAIRGNVDTRVRKLDQGLFDAVILAEAGLGRLNLSHRITQRLPLTDFTPAPGQGALAVVADGRRGEVVSTLALLNHPPSMAEVLAERAFLRVMGGGCKTPIGAVARVEGVSLHLQASTASPDGKVKIDVEGWGGMEEPEGLGERVARDMLKRIPEGMLAGGVVFRG